MSGVYEQTVAEHTWTPTMEIAAMCGDCPECGERGEHQHTEFSGGDGERGYVEYACCSCGTEWTDSYNLVQRTVYPRLNDDLLVEIAAEKALEATLQTPRDDRETIWIDGVEQQLFSVDEAYEIWASEQEYLAERDHKGLGGEVAIVMG
jgi:hypothetical protein